MAYYLVSVSNRTNLDLCIKFALAGFTNSINGLWTYTEIQEGDFISFLYGAKVFNLYKVEKKEAIKGAERIGPWPPVTFRMSGKTYYFPFRLYLKSLREFVESMVRPEFAYVAENLLLRGGYRKTHFQADQTTLQSVSQMGNLCDKIIERLTSDNYETFIPQLTWNRALVSPPEVFYFQEFILQSLIKQWLSNDANLQTLFNLSGLDNLQAKDFEVLSEKALPEGHIDILIKDAIPTGYSRKIIVEVKLNKSQLKDISQLESYMKELGDECIRGVLIAKEFPKKVRLECKEKGIKCFTYSFGEIDLLQKNSIAELSSRICINPVIEG
ncbi:MAG: endonuclease NucS domain-containing protein [bacterium]